MTTPRATHVALTIGFLAILFGVGLVQMALEAGRGEWPQALDLFRQKPTVAHLRAYERSLEDTSWLVKRLRPWMQYAQFVLLNDAGEKALVGRDGWFFYKPGVQYLTGKARPSPAATNDPVLAIRAFRDQLATRGIRLVVVPAPNKESIYPERLSSRARGLRTAVCPQTRELLERLRAAEVETVDLFRVFEEAKQRRNAPADQPLYLAQDSHWSPAGVELTARAVARRILERGWIEPGQIEYAGSPAPVVRLGDVPRMLQVPQLERTWHPESVASVQVVRQDNGQPYLNDANAEVLVLGDSFLRIYEQDEPGAAGFIAHLAQELRQPVTSLVSDGGASTLVRQELFRRPALLKNKKVVIWEFVERDIRFGAEGWQRVPLPPGSNGREMNNE